MNGILLYHIILTDLCDYIDLMHNINMTTRETFLMKVGLKEERWGDEQLIEKLLDMMQKTGADFSSSFRQLAEVVKIILKVSIRC